MFVYMCVILIFAIFRFIDTLPFIAKTAYLTSILPCYQQPVHLLPDIYYQLITNRTPIAGYLVYITVYQVVTSRRFIADYLV